MVSQLSDCLMKIYWVQYADIIWGGVLCNQAFGMQLLISGLVEVTIV